VCQVQILEKMMLDQIDQMLDALNCDLKAQLVVASLVWVGEDHQVFDPGVAVVADSGQS
jgi:hypothetical protein